jgi:hypothetical protein
MSDSLKQLAGVLGMMGSAHDGEVLNAARMAERLRKKLDKTWPVLLSGAGEAPDVSSYVIRALRAESRALRAEERASEFERRVVALEAEMERLKRSAGPSRPTRRPDIYTHSYTLPREVEDELIAAMRLSLTRATILQITGWPKSVRLRSVLPDIARRRGLRLTIFDEGRPFRFRFEKE